MAEHDARLLSRAMDCDRDCDWRPLPSGYIRCERCGSGFTPHGRERVKQLYRTMEPYYRKRRRKRLLIVCAIVAFLIALVVEHVCF